MAKAYSDLELSSWFDPLHMELDEGGKVLRVSFPHAFFCRWFLNNLRSDFEKQALGLFDDINFIYDGTPYSQREVFSAQDSAVRMAEPALSRSLQEEKPGMAGLNAEAAYEEKAAQSHLPLMEEQRFDNFLVNRKNDMVLEAARQAVSGGVLCTPFVLYGKSCTGKSHLLNAMANALEAHGKLFTFFRIGLANPHAIAQSDYRHILHDAVFIDDAQRLADFPHEQDALASMIDHFRATRKLLVISLDMRPSHCPGLNQKLLSRLHSGLVLELKKPDLDIRAQYVEQQNRAKDLDLGKDKILSIAQRFTDIRLIDGFLTQLAFYRNMRQKRSHGESEVFFPDAAEMLERDEEQRLLTPNYIISAVARHFALSPDDITGKSRDKRIILARHIAIMLCRELLGLSLPKVGRLFGNRDHSSVLHSIKRIRQLQESDKNMHIEVEKMRKMCLHGE